MRTYIVAWNQRSLCATGPRLVCRLFAESVADGVDKNHDQHEGSAEIEGGFRHDVVECGFTFERRSNAATTRHRITFTGEEDECGEHDRDKHADSHEQVVCRLH